MHLLSGNIRVGPAAVTGCELLGAGDHTTLSGCEGNSLPDPLFFQILATCSPISTRERMGKRQKELVKRCALGLLQLTALF